MRIFENSGCQRLHSMYVACDKIVMMTLKWHFLFVYAILYCRSARKLGLAICPKMGVPDCSFLVLSKKREKHSLVFKGKQEFVLKWCIKHIIMTIGVCSCPYKRKLKVNTNVYIETKQDISLSDNKVISNK